MFQERVSTDIYVFTSDLYVQTTAGVILTPEGVVVIDTLPFPLESKEIRQFVSRRPLAAARYLIFTHYHADHTYGGYLFPEARVVAHARCRYLLATRGEQGLARARAESANDIPELANVVLRLPDITLDDGDLRLCVGKKTLRLVATPGHSEDMVSVFIEEDRVLFAGDTVMPVPLIADGDLATLRQSLEKIMGMEPECIVQGHGEVILRGEVQDTVRASIAYLDTIGNVVAEAIAKKRGMESLLEVSIERCGLSRVALSGQAPNLHAVNLMTLYKKMQLGAE